MFRFICVAVVVVITSIALLSCSSSPNYKPYPVVTMPEDANPEEPDWKGIDLTPKPPVLPVSAQEEAKRLFLPPGYVIEPILTEPQIEQPAAISFDGNGRMYVLELRSYMLTADSDNELDSISIISRWEDKDNDGVYETGTPFVKNLVFPRFVLPFGANSILTMESNADNIYKYTDTDNDGVADQKELFTTNFGRSGNVEHQQAFLFWGMDNWLYSTVNAFRIKWTPNGILREPTGPNHAQWGVTQDDDGKIWFQGGASGVPSYFQFPIHYGEFEIPDEAQYAEGFDVPWGMPMGLADVQGGMDEVRQPDGSIARVTGAAGNDVFRGHRLPANMVGQYFYGEPVARIVRQVNPIVKEGFTTLHNYFQDWKSEFIKSSDPLFRPVDLTTAPDGTLYITDMYHGIIQEGNWTQPGSYLRTKIDQYQMDKVIGLGRIWRVRYEGIERDTQQPHMLDETPAELVAHFDHPNGWWRDMAQQLLVQAQDKSVVPALQEMVRNSKNMLARFHAIWTLEGLGALDVSLVRELMKDSNPRIRIQALRASETLYKAGEKSLAVDYKKALKEQNTDVLEQAILTCHVLKISEVTNIFKFIKNTNQAKGIQLITKQILNPVSTELFGESILLDFNEEQGALITHGNTIYGELCSTCHGMNGTGILVGNQLMAPALTSSDRVQGHQDYVIKVLLRGMSGSIDGKTYAGSVMVPMGTNSDEWIASVASFIRTNFNNDSQPVTVSDVARIRKETEGQAKTYSHESLMTSIPQKLEMKPEWKITASHSALMRVGMTSSPMGAFNFEGWTTGVGQESGMWFQIEFPTSQKLSEIQFTSPEKRVEKLSIATHPRAFTVQVSIDGKNWRQIKKAKGIGEFTSVAFAPIDAKFLKIVSVAKDEAPWSMRNLTLFAFK